MCPYECCRIPLSRQEARQLARRHEEREAQAIISEETISAEQRYEELLRYTESLPEDQNWEDTPYRTETPQ